MLARSSWVALLVLASSAACADTAAITWTNPTSFTDGSPLDQPIAQTNLHCSAVVIAGVRSSCSIADSVASGAGTSFTVTYTAPGSTYSICFQAQTVLADASSSDWSAEACKTVKRPGGPKITIK